MRWLIALAAMMQASFAVAQAPAETNAHARAALSQGLGALLRADGAAALPIFSAIPDSQLAESSRQLRDCILQRLRTDPDDIAGLKPDDDPVVASVTTAYRRYWRRAVMEPDRRDAAQQALLAELQQIAGSDDPDATRLLELLRSKIEERGAWAINGRTGFLLDLIVWRNQDARDEIVGLPEGLQAARVYYLDDFVSRGWSNYLSCDRSGTGGWANDDGLFVIVPNYDSLTDEAFRISHLVHEAQHFADYGRFPGLAGWELEYRAKLAEMASAVESRDRLLARFASNIGVDPSEAHSYANARVLTELRARLRLAHDAGFGTVSVPDLQNAANSALWDDSAARRSGRSAGGIAELPEDGS